jgi:hypothetical protein
MIFIILKYHATDTWVTKGFKEGIGNLMKIGNVADPFANFYLNPSRYNTVTMVKWTKRYLEESLLDAIKQFEECLRGTGFSVIAASRIPERTRPRIAGKKSIRLRGKTYYFLPIETIQRLERNEHLRQERNQKKEVDTKQRQPASNTQQDRQEQPDKPKVKARRIKRFKGGSSR